MTAADSQPDTPRLVHEALLYSTPGELVEVAAPFVLEGLNRGESVLVITREANVGPLRDALGGAADSVEWADTNVWHPRPIDRIRALHRYVTDELTGGAERVRIVDESMWPQDPNAAASDLKRFESICNLVFAALPVWMICPYDASLVNHVLPDAYRTHPVIRDARVSRQASVAYLQPGEFFKALDVEEQLAPPPADARVLRTATPGQARSFIVAEASAAGLHPDRIQDLELATCEMATNAARHAHQGAEMHVWTEPGEIVCRVSDTGTGMTDPLAGYGEPKDPGLGGWGLLLARRLCDGVEVRSGAEGTVVQLRMRVPGSPHAPQ